MINEIHKTDEIKNSGLTSYDVLVVSIKDCIIEKLTSHLKSMFDNANDFLFSLSEKAESNADKALYFDIARLLKIEHEGITKLFLKSLNDHLKPANKKTSTAISFANNFDEESLSLVDQDIMEEIVIVSSMHSRAMNIYGESVNHLESRLEVLSTHTENAFDKSALAPKNICDIFLTALTFLQIPSDEKRIILTPFDHFVCRQLSDLYASLNILLIDNNILPKINAKNSNARPITLITSQPGDGKIPTITNIDDYTKDPELQKKIGQVINALLNGNLDTNIADMPASFSTNTNNIDTDQFYEHNEVIKALSNIQKDKQESKSDDNIELF
jgi:hypothetical protein